MVPYYSIIGKYIGTETQAFRVYSIHVTLVTKLALKIGRRERLSTERMEFIEEAAMLHDIGIIKVDSPEIGCYGKLPYLCHLTEGRAILEKEGLPAHARVAANHVGVGGLSKDEIIEGNLPLLAEDLLCETLEEKIISYADVFYSKNPKKLWQKKGAGDIKEKLANRPKQLERFKKWYDRFGE